MYLLWCGRAADAAPRRMRSRCRRRSGGLFTVPGAGAAAPQASGPSDLARQSHAGGLHTLSQAPGDTHESGADAAGDVRSCVRWQPTFRHSYTIVHGPAERMRSMNVRAQHTPCMQL